MASAPEASRAWLLIEHPGPWPHEPTETALPTPLDAMVRTADTLGIRVQMIRRPGRRTASNVRRVFVGWTAGTGPWLRCGELTAGSAALTELELKELSTGIAPTFGRPTGEPVFLVCAHARRNACCARFGAPLAQAASGAGVGNNACRRAPIRRQPGDLAARPVLRAGRRGRGDRRDQRVLPRHDHARALSRPGRPAEGDSGSGVRAADAGRLAGGCHAGLTGLLPGLTGLRPDVTGPHRAWPEGRSLMVRRRR